MTEVVKMVDDKGTNSNTIYVRDEIFNFLKQNLAKEKYDFIVNTFAAHGIGFISFSVKPNALKLPVQNNRIINRSFSKTLIHQGIQTDASVTGVGGNGIDNNSVDPHNINNMPMFIECSTQVNDSDFLNARALNEPEPEAKIQSNGRQTKPSRTKRMNVPHVKKSSEIVKTQSHNNGDTKRQKKILPKKPSVKDEVVASNFGLPEEIVNGELLTSEFLREDNFVQLVQPTETHRLNNLKEAWDRSIVFIDGYLPIHEAAQSSDIIVLKQQCEILHHRKGTIDIATEDESETPLQLAILHGSSTECIELLLHYRSDVNYENDDGNTALHLCAFHNDNPAIFKMLLKKVPFEKLAKFNYDGLSALHLAVLTGKYMFVKVFLEHIDECLGITPIVDPNVQDELQLIELYQNFIISFTSDEKPNLNLNPLKMNIINLRDMKSGRTPLFLAANISSDAMCFILMSHGADPRVDDLSGTDCTALSNDIINNKIIASAVSNTIQYLKFRELETDKSNQKIKSRKMGSIGFARTPAIATRPNRKRSMSPSSQSSDDSTLKIKIMKNNKKNEVRNSS